jgi:hypothetical protein
MTELAENIQSLRDQLELAVALLCRMTPWKTGVDTRYGRTVSIDTPSGKVYWDYSKENASLFELLPAIENPAETRSAETNRERITQVIKKMDTFNRQLHSSR